MKNILKVLFVCVLSVTLFACNNQPNNEIEAEDVQQGQTQEEQDQEELVGTTTLANPMVEYESLEDINKAVGVEIASPGIMGKENEQFLVISKEIAQYSFDLNGYSWTIRGACITEHDISGIYHEHNNFVANQDGVLYTNEFYLDRFFDDDKQYTIFVADPDNLDQEQFMSVCNELESIMKWHTNDELVGDYQDTTSNRAFAFVERKGDEYTVVVYWSTSASETTEWTMYGRKQDNKIVYGGENITNYAYDESGEIVSNDSTATNYLGSFEIQDGKLLWNNCSDKNNRDLVFEKIPSVE